MSVGRGKTLLSISCAIEGLKKKMFDKIVILSPKAVQDEFVKNLNLYYKLSGIKSTKLKERFKMIAYNSWKAYEEFRKYFKHHSINKTLFIIDEAHLFMKSIIKVNLNLKDMELPQNKYVGNAKRIYDLIKSATNKKVLALTGTPSAKTPFETIPMFNLAYNKPLFEDNIEAFNDKYLDLDIGEIVHAEELKRKIDGLVAYVPAGMRVNDKGIINKNVPIASELKLVNVEMSYKQYKQYLIDYEKECNENGFTNKKNIYGLLFGAVSTFHTKTFEDCIYWNDQLTNEPYENRYVGKIKIDEEHCPKIIKMYKDSSKVDGLCVFYFRYTKMYGIKCMSKMLKLKGFEKVKDVKNVFDKKGKRFVVFSGDMSDSVRTKMKDAFNDERNKRGDYIKYILLSPSGSVGITLKNVRYLGIGSVEFNYSAVRQILGRVNRLNSHNDLPLKDRTVDNYIYVMRKNEKYYKEHTKKVDKICSRTSYGITEIAPIIEKIILYDSYKDDEVNESFKKKVLIPASITEEVFDRF